MTAVLSDSVLYIESGRVYLEQDNPHNLFIRCHFCCVDIIEWSDFLQHLELNHQDLEHHDSNIQYEDTETYQELSTSPTTSIAQPSEFTKNDSVVGLLDESHLDANSFIEQKDDVDDYELEELKEEVEEELANLCHSATIDSTNEVMQFKGTLHLVTGKQDEEYSCIQNEYTMGKEDIATSADLDNSEHYATNDVFHQAGNTKAEKPNRRRRWSETHDRAFYHMTRTAPEIMHQFIELIKIHECQWKPDHPEYDDVSKRSSSAEEIGRVLQNRWNLPPISAQSARNSILQLRRWFELEYVEHMRNSNYKSKNIDYYQRLLGFLPYKHLRSLVCDECNRRFRTESGLLQHKHRSHNAPLPYRCKFCGRGYAHKSLLLLHENRHTQNKTWLCQHCGYNSSNKSDYRAHLTKHTDKRAYVCIICGLSYKSSTSLAVHRRTHVPPTLRCQYCEKMFHEKYRLKQHVQLKHIEKIQAGVPIETLARCIDEKTSNALEEESMQEEECNDTDLEVFMDNCIEVRFDCNHCDDDFASKEELDTHIQNVH